EVRDSRPAEGADSAFVSPFARYDLPHRGDPRLDLDMASAGVGKVLERRLGRTYPHRAWEAAGAFNTPAAALPDVTRVDAQPAPWAAGKPSSPPPQNANRGPPAGSLEGLRGAQQA